MSVSLKGILAAIIACVLWGLSSLLYFRLSDVQATEILAHRTVWSFVLIAIFCLYTHRIKATIETFSSKKTMLLLCLSSLFVAVNWLGFIWAVQTGHGIEASLGYYIMPLINAAFGILFLSEKLSKDKLVAIIFAALGVLVLAFGLGVAPWFAILVSCSFSTYSLIRKLTDVGPITGTFVENILMLPIAVVWLYFVHTYSLKDFSPAEPAAFGRDLTTSLLLVLTGIFTGLPLILYTYASRAIGLTTTGLFFYINPTLQLVVAILAFNEHLTIAHMIALPLIWTGLLLVSVTSIAKMRKARQDKKITPQI